MPEALLILLTVLSSPDEAEVELEAIAPATSVHNQPEGFGFGSYGRVGAGTDLNGATPRPTNVVQHGPRVVENTYLELDLYYGMRAKKDVFVRLVATPALAGDLFHHSGDFDAELALRNLYAEAIFSDTYDVWVGSRMYRGDDIYLLDYWPLDNLNTVGGGLGLTTKKVDAALHFGVTRLLDQFQFQEFAVPARLTGSETIVQLDRQRFIGSLKGTYRLLGSDGGFGLKLKGNVEIHGLPAGEVRNEDGTTEPLASDFGYSVGGQIGIWGFADRYTHLNLFARYSRGLAAYDPLSVPTGLNETKQTWPGAQELILGLSGTYELGDFTVLAGGYSRYFEDADRVETDVDDGWEGVADLRPSYALFDFLQLAVDLSYQQRFPKGPSPTALEVLNPAVAAVAPMIVVSPFGLGAYARPHVRLIYRAAHLSEGARDLYALEDARRAEPWVHFVGLQAEWWFNSNYRR